MSECPICTVAATDERFTIYDDRFGYPGLFQLRSCRPCGHAFLGNAAFSDAEIGRIYSDYYPRRSMKVEDYRPHVERQGYSAWLDGARASAFRWVPKGVRVLDIGSGFGQSLGYHAARECEVWGVESDENAQHVAEHHGFNVRIGVFTPSDFPAAYFDVVTLDQVIEHMRDPVETMAGIRTMLKPGGTAILSTPNARGWGAWVFGRRWINWHAPYHLHFFSRRSMEIAAERAGLVAESMGTVTSSEWLNYQWVHLVTRPELGQPSIFWTNAGTYRRSQRAALRIASLMHRTKVNHLITRLFDTLGLGDSQLFILRQK